MDQEDASKDFYGSYGLVNSKEKKVLNFLKVKEINVSNATKDVSFNRGYAHLIHIFVGLGPWAHSHYSIEGKELLPRSPSGSLHRSSSNVYERKD